VRSLAKIVEQADAPAAGRFAQSEQRVELRRRHAFVFVFGIRLVDEPPLLDNVCQPVGHPGVGGRGVAASPPGFLVIPLDALGQVEMGHKAYVRLVDAHAEGDGRDHHQTVFTLKARLMLRARRRVHSSVIGEGKHTFRGQPRSGFVDLAPRETVNNSGVSGMFDTDEIQQLGARVVLVDDGVADVGTIKARNEHAGIGESKARSDFSSRLRVGGSCQCDSRNARVTLVEQ
jgi:hypothetical protein